MLQAHEIDQLHRKNYASHWLHGVSAIKTYTICGFSTYNAADLVTTRDPGLVLATPSRAIFFALPRALRGRNGGRKVLPKTRVINLPGKPASYAHCSKESRKT